MAYPDLAPLTALLKDGMLAGQMPFLRVTSGSMQPLLQVGDEVGVQSVTVAQLQPGDIVVVSDRNQILTHRFWKRQDAAQSSLIVTRGDRVLSYDQSWAADQLLGRAVVRRRHENMLWLDYGLGRALNRALAQISCYEGQLLNLSSSPCPESRQPASREFVRLSLRALAEALTRAVDVYLSQRRGFR